MSPDFSSTAMIVSVVAMMGWLFLNIREFESHRLGAVKTLQYAAAWIAIFGVVAFLASRYGG